MSALLKSITTPPSTGIGDYELETKYVLAYRMSLFLSLTIGLLTLVLFCYFDLTVALVTSVAFFTILATTLYIRKTKSYLVPTIVFNIIGALCCTTALFFIHSQPHFVDSFWITINVLFVFLVLGPRWGLGFSIFHAICMAIYYLFFFSYHMQHLIKINDEQIMSTVVNSTLCFAIIGYLGWENIRTNEVAKKKLSEAQDVLRVQYNIISKQNEEKTVMLKEIHHRVKNNLQIITSLLRLQSRELENPEAIAKFKDATHRVIAMSMIHEKMYQSDHLSTLHLREYLHDLSSDLVSSYQSGYPVSLKIECDIESIGLRSIVPIALILNELISNSLKYAFDDYENCLISISFMHFQGKKCKLVYKDSGTWKAPSRQGSFGLDLIESLTDQLEGTMELHTYPETIVEITFSPQEDQ